MISWTQLAPTQEFQTQVQSQDVNRNNTSIATTSVPVNNNVPVIDQVATMSVIIKSKFDEYFQVYKGLHI